MKLEEDIKQTKGFKDEWEKAFLNIIYTANWLNSHQYRFLKQFGLSTEQYNVLRILKGQYPEPATVNLLKERMLDKMSNASRLVEKLKKKGLVDRQSCADDRRQVDIYITQKGLTLLDEIYRKYPGARETYGHISEEDLRTLNRILDQFRD